MGKRQNDFMRDGFVVELETYNGSSPKATAWGTTTIIPLCLCVDFCSTPKRVYFEKQKGTMLIEQTRVKKCNGTKIRLE